MESVLHTVDPVRAVQADDVAGELQTGPQLSIIVPTFNENENVAELVSRLRACLGARNWEVIFVDDDSPDGTAETVRKLAETDRRVRCIQRIGRRGLSSACIEGMLASTSPYVAVIDADLQHDETLLPRMWDLLVASGTDMVVGSRYAEGGGVGEWGARRAAMSRFATTLSRLVVPAELTDPMSGFFMLRRTVFLDCVRNLSALGFKLLTDLFASSEQPLRFKEFAYEFKPRRAGESKLDSLVSWDYAMLLLDKLVGHIVPVRFIAFSIVGALGFAVHVLVLSLTFKTLQRSFIESQTIAAVVAMTFNFFVNNILTYRDVRLRGWRWLRGWAAFVAACSLGAIANVGIASYLYREDKGWLVAAVAGIVVGAVWNYAATTVFTWAKPRR
jgi:dolichol-phosphate mannosyltransferase